VLVCENLVKLPEAVNHEKANIQCMSRNIRIYKCDKWQNMQSSIIWSCSHAYETLKNKKMTTLI